ncbi:hypothetical protein CsatB_008705 [Cannabis sativa]|uniref:Uncharacterized protein n=2 Tax=Cannabis sativa TaxID=3483 RepID=A0A7J6DMF0_CANSA|nr:uncharacterized protein LOC115700640 [Cannabis sativa]KAF4347281.1 hypothetical protein G4B88_012848 [Cannabis sativa]KAF4357294.1 hypothetical protein F8388_002802 [Cannabis sativa]KAF4359024.1 hypothetical protein F8388_015071 [Cannabis sativa]
MKDTDSQSLPMVTRRESPRPPVTRFFGKSSYKFWVIAAVLLLAFWSMFTGSVTLKWSTGNLSRIYDDFNSPTYDDDLDILEVEERVKVVRHMWDLYTQSRRTQLPRFWQEAFEAAYENLVSDVPALRDSAFSEIAKISILTNNLDPFHLKSTVSVESKKKSKHTEKRKDLKPSKMVDPK